MLGRCRGKPSFHAQKLDAKAAVPGMPWDRRPPERRCPGPGDSLFYPPFLRMARGVCMLTLSCILTPRWRLQSVSAAVGGATENVPKLPLTSSHAACLFLLITIYPESSEDYLPSPLSLLLSHAFVPTLSCTRARALHVIRFPSTCSVSVLNPLNPQACHSISVQPVVSLSASNVPAQIQ